MSVAKPDTRAAFAPSIPSGPDITNPAISAIRFDGKLDRSILSAQIHQVLLGMARSRNAVSSFRLEGENVDLERARQVLETQSPESPAERGVLQLSQAYRAISEGRLPEFTIRGFEEAHREIFTGVLDNGIVGELKTSANVITDVTGTQERFRPTPPENVRADLDALLLWLEQNQGRLLPTVVAAIFFAEFEAIHPFSNGNGRLGRYLNIALLRKLGLKNSALIPLDTRFFRTSDHYYEYLATTNTGRDYLLWTRYYGNQVQKAYEIADRRGDLRKTTAQFSKASTRSMLLWVLTGSGGWFQRGDYPNPKHYSGPALWGALHELVSAGILDSRGESKGRQYRVKSTFLAGVYDRMG
jgi:Fic family protein